MQVGSGGQRRKALRGKGPTPKASERTGHPAARRAKAADRRAAAGSTRAQGRSGGRGGTARDRDAGPELIAGRNQVVEALRSAVPASTLYVAERVDSDDRVREALKLANAQGLAILEVPRPELDRMASGVHQGIALSVPAYSYAHPDDLLARATADGGVPLLVALDGVTDPRNLGAVVRSAAAFGAHGVVVPERRAAGLTASAWRTSAGAAARVPVARATNLARQLGSYRDAGLFVVGLDAGADVTIGQVELATDPLVLVIGSEGRGLSRLVREACDVVAAIPMAGEMESLNAGVAAGIALYEIARRRAG
jgi:23S rRNA (guanosine2251-2'-O)-methyltransferase